MEGPFASMKASSATGCSFRSLAAAGKVVEDGLALVFAVALKTSLQALEGEVVLVRAVDFRVFGHVVDALQEVRHLHFSSFRVASSSVGTQSSLVELLHLAFAQSSILESVDERFESANGTSNRLGLSRSESSFASTFSRILTSRSSKVPAF